MSRWESAWKDKKIKIKETLNISQINDSKTLDVKMTYVRLEEIIHNVLLIR